MKANYTCLNEECEYEMVVRFYPETPNRYMHGRFEDAEQGSAAECRPSECPECGEEVDVEEVASNFEG